MICFCFRWLTSRKIRMAVQMRHQIRKHLNAQRDLLSAEAVRGLEEAIEKSAEAIRHGAIPGDIQSTMQALEASANQWLRPYRSAGIRENVEMFLVVAAALMGFRTFFFQPMAIPTGSAQPTFYGVTSENLQGKTEAVIPSRFKRWYFSWVKGEKYYHITAKNSGRFKIIDEKPQKLFPFISRQRFQIGDRKYTVWFPPKRISFSQDLWYYAGLRSYPYSREGDEAINFREGDEVIKIKVTSGDHLFVNRFIYNFRRPRRGETIVFKSTNLPGLTPNTHYIKRLVALGGEKISIGDDRLIRINGQSLDASTPGFEFVYNFNPNKPPQKDVYSGHVNGTLERRLKNWKHRDGTMAGWRKMQEHFKKKGPHKCKQFDGESFRVSLALNFPDANTKLTVRKNHYLAFGDNTMNSQDSRVWPSGDDDYNSDQQGGFPRENVIGKSAFVFWPISERFGWHTR